MYLEWSVPIIGVNDCSFFGVIVLNVLGVQRPLPTIPRVLTKPFLLQYITHASTLIVVPNGATKSVDTAHSVGTSVLPQSPT